MLAESLRTFVVGAVLVGCSELSGLEDYSVREQPKKEEPKPAPFLSGEACNTCIEAKCGEQLATCAGDALCSALLAEQRKCSDPNCRFQAAYELKVHEVAFEQADWPQAIVKVSTCVRDSCGSECSIGRSWDCLGRYSWDSPPTGARTVRHKVFWLKLGGVSDAWVKACTRADPQCDMPVGSGTTSSQGLVDFDISPSDPLISLLVEPGPEGVRPPSRHSWQRPRYTRELTFGGVTTTALLEFMAGQFSVAWDKDLANVWAGTLDCNGFGADDVVYELLVGSPPEPCSGCRIRYLTEGIDPDPQANSTTTSGGGWALINQIEPRLALLSARVRSSGLLVAEAILTLHKGRIEVIEMHPLTAGDDN